MESYDQVYPILRDSEPPIYGLTLIQHFATTTTTPDFVLRQVNEQWIEPKNKLAAIAYTDALYKIEVAKAMIEELNKQKL